MKKNIIWNAIGLTINAFTSLFLMIIVTRINGLDIAGIFSYSFSITTLIYTMALFYTRTYQISNYNNNKNYNQFMTARCLFVILAIIFALFFSLVNRFRLLKISIIMLLTITRGIEAICDCTFAELQNNEQLYKVGISLSLKGIVGTLTFLLIDVLFNNIILSLLGLAISYFLIMIFYDRYNIKKIITFVIDNRKTKLIILESFSIFLFGLLSCYMANLPKYIITYFVSNKNQSIFGILIMPATMLSLIGNYLIIPFITKLKKYKIDNDFKKFSNLVNKILVTLFGIGIFGMIFIYFFGIPILNFLYNINIDKLLFELEIIIIGSIFCALSLILSNVMTIINDNKSQLIIYLISSIIATIVGVILISTYKIKGASITFLIENIILFNLYFIKYKLNVWSCKL